MARGSPADTGGRPRVTVRITLPGLESLKVEGGNDVRLAGFKGGESNIRIEGAAHIKARGRLDELTIHMTGAGHADFGNVIADAAHVTVIGVGSVYVHPQDTLDATMNGVGAILYSGSPRQVNTHMNGIGTSASARRRIAVGLAMSKTKRRSIPICYSQSTTMQRRSLSTIRQK